jgi:cysteine sulfinate desulfinase/cysteine desulfurase-like protein
MNETQIYLDFNASTPLAPEVADAMRPFLTEHFGNPSSHHWAGRGTRIVPFVHGAGHEQGRRAGTENVLLAVGLGVACEVATRWIGMPGSRRRPALPATRVEGRGR